MWPQVVLELIRSVPDIIKAIEQIMPNRPGPEKLAGAVQLLQAQEPSHTESEAVTVARAAMLSAQVAYLNALSEADV